MTVRLYRPGDEKQILSLFETVFQRSMDERVWSWKYLSSPNNLKAIILVFEEDGEILGHTALWVHPISVDGKEGKIGLRIDTMVNPSARGKGIYKQLSEKLIQVAEKENINLLYGFPAEKAMELQIKYIKAHHLSNVSRLVYLNQPITALGSRFKPFRIFRFLDPLYSSVKRVMKARRKEKELLDSIRQVEAFDSQYHFMSLEEKIHLRRNAEYLNWRYAEHPTNDYRILQYLEDGLVKGYVVYRRFKNEQGISIGLILDLIAFGKDKALIEGALLKKSIYKMKDVALIQAWTMPNQRNTKAYKSAGFFVKDEPMPLVIKDIRHNDIDVKNPDHWFLSMGDVDSF